PSRFLALPPGARRRRGRRARARADRLFRGADPGRAPPNGMEGDSSRRRGLPLGSRGGSSGGFRSHDSRPAPGSSGLTRPRWLAVALLGAVAALEACSRKPKLPQIERDLTRTEQAWLREEPVQL